MRTDAANRQLLAIGVYVAEESGDLDTAIRIIEKLENAVGTLGEMPHRGALPRTEALRKQGHRVLVAEPYLIFYRCDEQRMTVTVTAVLHAKQDYMRVIR